LWFLAFSRMMSWWVVLGLEAVQWAQRWEAEYESLSAPELDSSGASSTDNHMFWDVAADGTDGIGRAGDWCGATRRL
jgi:hypothetical protein